MKSFKYVGPFEAVEVPALGLFEEQAVKQGGVVQVADEDADGFACQPSNWEPLDGYVPAVTNGEDDDTEDEDDGDSQ